MFPAVSSQVNETLDAAETGGSWEDIAVASPSTEGTNSDIEVSYTGSGRTIRVGYIANGVVSYRIDSGSWVVAPNHTDISHTSGQTLGFKYTNATKINETRMVNLHDQTRNEVLASFEVSYTGGPFYGGGVGDPEP